MDDLLIRPATARVVDFRHIKRVYYRRDDRGLMRCVKRDGYPFSDDGINTTMTTFEEGREPGTQGIHLSATAKQQRARNRRRLKKGQRLSTEAFTQLYKPIEEWDPEELARGRPRNAAGDFRGRPPAFISREIHERAMERFKTIIRTEMNVHTINAVAVVASVLDNEEVDVRGKPVVPASTKMDAAKFLLDHVVGKPVQPTQSDISVKLQGILGAVMVNPSDVTSMGMPGQYIPAHMGSRGVIEGSVMDDEDEEEEEGGGD